MRRWFLRCVNFWQAITSGTRAIFHRAAGQAIVLVGGALVILAGSYLIAFGVNQLAQLFGSALAGIGTSLVAVGLTIKILSKPDDIDKQVCETGCCFVGLRTQYDETLRFGPKGGWDRWIEQTPRGGELVVIGQKNWEWAKSSSEALKKTMHRDVTLRFVFMGTSLDPDRTKQPLANITAFKTFLTERGWEKTIDAQKFQFLVYDPSVNTSLPSKVSVPTTGFYWNGRQLMIKVYLVERANPVCPILVFDTPGTGTKFDLRDFEVEPLAVALSRPHTIWEAAQGMKSILEDSLPLDEYERRVANAGGSS